MKNSPASTCKPRWFRFGPGLVIAIIAAMFVYQRAPMQRAQPLRTVPQASEMARDKSASSSDNALPAAPDADWLWSQRAMLNLNPQQTRRLQNLRTRWQRDTRELQADLARASVQFEREMEQEKAHPDTLQVLAARGAPVADLSRQLAQARRAWWNEARVIFSPTQRAQAEAAWRQRFVAPTTYTTHEDTK